MLFDILNNKNKTLEEQLLHCGSAWAWQLLLSNGMELSLAFSAPSENPNHGICLPMSKAGPELQIISTAVRALLRISRGCPPVEGPGSRSLPFAPAQPFGAARGGQRRGRRGWDGTAGSGERRRRIWAVCCSRSWQSLCGEERT